MTNFSQRMNEEEQNQINEQIQGGRLKEDQNLSLMARGFIKIPNNTATQYQVRTKRKNLESVGHRNLHPLQYAEQTP